MEKNSLLLTIIFGMFVQKLIGVANEQIVYAK